ncbi:MAG: hypothetical protein SP1CHLAM54_08250 [Chlamydiia bacterium]|nr:hypothetical protein [Chlamydiia bacterium]MCH9615731.1 hypothetical protein [Chlamydiia bacterium]MCH9628866.1 hypothetical protein [Chlamydiia bacterium]
MSFSVIDTGAIKGCYSPKMGEEKTGSITESKTKTAASVISGGGGGGSLKDFIALRRKNLGIAKSAPKSASVSTRKSSKYQGIQTAQGKPTVKRAPQTVNDNRTPHPTPEINFNQTQVVIDIPKPYIDHSGV